MPDSLPPEDEIARLRVEKADPDAIMAEYLSAYEQANGKEPNFRLVFEAGWVHFRSRESGMTWDKKRLKTLGDMTQRLLDRANIDWMSRGAPTHPNPKREEH